MTQVLQCIHRSWACNVLDLVYGKVNFGNIGFYMEKSENCGFFENWCSLRPDFFFFNSVLRPFQDYFSSYETGQSVGGAKTGEPREKPPDTPASRTWLVSHVAKVVDANN